MKYFTVFNRLRDKKNPIRITLNLNQMARISWDLILWLGLATRPAISLETSKSEELSISQIKEFYWNEKKLPKSPRGIQWHQCGRKPKVPKNARDVMCHGDKCHVICDKGAKRQSKSVIKCQRKKKGYRFGCKRSMIFNCF